jgi:hypothetical protein
MIPRIGLNGSWSKDSSVILARRKRTACNGVFVAADTASAILPSAEDGLPLVIFIHSMLARNHPDAVIAVGHARNTGVR